MLVATSKRSLRWPDVHTWREDHGVHTGCIWAEAGEGAEQVLKAAQQPHNNRLSPKANRQIGLRLCKKTAEYMFDPPDNVQNKIDLLSHVWRTHIRSF